MEGMEEVLKEFIVESYEGLDQLDRDLVTLEEDPSSAELLSRIFRTIHTIKGSSGFLALGKLEAIAHVGENLLSLLRDGRRTLTADMTSALLSMADAIRGILGHVEQEQNEGFEDHSKLVEVLTQLVDTGQVMTQVTGPAESTPSANDPPSEPMNSEPMTSEPTNNVAEPAPPVESAASVESTPPVAPSKEPSPASRDEASAAPATEARAQSVSDNSIRVDVGLLDTLMNLVGELVLARNQILQYTATQEDTAFTGTSQRLNLVTTELQEGVMKTRMQPIGNVWSKFPRVVRDLAISCGKKVRIEMEGRDTELDKTIIESIKDPLTHAIRNAVDHGIEKPDARAERGKPEDGTIWLRAFHEGGQVNIEISDDGGGIDPEKVKRKAISTGVVTSDRAARMGEKELINLITMPGFSTAEAITNVSGRGVGMDVVRTNIEKIGGVIDIQSNVGEGTTIKIKIPLTLAIIPALIVTSGGDRFAIPQVNLLELVRLEGSTGNNGIETIHGSPVYRLRGNLLPLAYLNAELERDGPTEAPDEAIDAPDEGESKVVNIVVLQADDRQFGLVVESILDTEEIVVKPLGKQLKSVPAFAGAAIMGDGKVALILDVVGLARKATIISEDRASGHDQGAGSVAASSERETLLLVALGEDGRAAIRLSTVARLEEFDISAVERAASQEVVQYRQEIMPLIRLSQVLGQMGGGLEPENGKFQIIVVRAKNGRSVGLAVDRILDIVEDEVKVVRHSSRRGICGAMAVQGRVTDLLDVEGIIDGALPGFVQLEEVGA
ncbi:MAG: chemotaxis protein CheA [Planctomycetota bacterium]